MKDVDTLFLNRALAPRRWTLWQAPRPFVLTVVIVCTAACLATLPLSEFDSSHLGRFITLALLGSIATTLCVRMERARSVLDTARVPNLVATWTFAGALSLDHVLAATLVIVIYGAQWPAKKDVYAGKFHKYFLSAANVIVCVRLAQFVINPVLAGLIIVTTNILLVSLAWIALGQAKFLRRMADLKEQGTEVLTLVLGFAEATLLDRQLVLGVAVLPVIFVIQYVSLRRSLAQSSTLDPETGLLSAQAWYALGGLRLSGVREAIVLNVLIADAAGLSLAECVELLKASVRAEDLIGRTPDGFSVLVAVPGGRVLAEVLAAQMQTRFAMSGVETVVGLAVTPDEGRSADLQAMAVAASAELIIKTAGARV